VRKRHGDHVSGLAWSPNGLLLATGGYVAPPKTRPVAVWDAATGEQRATYRSLSNGVRELRWSPEGALIGAVCWHGSVEVWDWRTGSRAFRCYEEAQANGRAAHIAWSPNGKYLATSGPEARITIWEVGSWRPLLTYDGHAATGTGPGVVAWSPDGSRIASASYDKTMQVWESASGKPLWRAETDIPVWSDGLAWSPNGRSIAMGRTGGTIEIWDAATSQRIRTIMIGGNGAPMFAWSPDGNTLAVVNGHYAKTLHLWDPFTDRRILSWQVHWAAGLAWSPDGSRLACGCGKSIIEIWAVR
jgi:WD40 repeat protein